MLSVVPKAISESLTDLTSPSRCGCAVFASFVGDARDKGDVSAAKRRAVLGFFFLLPLLGINAEPVDPLLPGKVELSSKESAALNRLIQRLKQRQGSTDAAALLKLLTCPDTQQLEDMYTSSLQQRGGKELKGTTVQDQVSGCLRSAGSCEGQRTLGLNLHYDFPGMDRQIAMTVV